MLQVGDDVVKASRETEELYNAIVKVCGSVKGGQQAQSGRRQAAAGSRQPAPQAALLTCPHPTPRLPCTVLQNDIKLVYKKIEEGADVNFVFGRAYNCPEGYTPLMVACHRGRCAGRVYSTAHVPPQGTMAPRHCVC